MVRTIVVKEPLFRTTLFIFIGSPEEVRKYLKRKWKSYIDEDDDLTGSIVDQAAGTTFILGNSSDLKQMGCIWLLSFDGGIFDISILQHELLHWIFTTLSETGITHSPDSEECYTYMLEYYTRQIYKELVKRKWSSIGEPHVEPHPDKPDTGRLQGDTSKAHNVRPKTVRQKGIS
jgi:hypothetical protein